MSLSTFRGSHENRIAASATDFDLTEASEPPRRAVPARSGPTR